MSKLCASTFSCALRMARVMRRCSIGHALLHAEALHQALHAVGAEDAQQVVLEREVEARRAGIALPAAAAAELVVDAARLVALGAEDVEAAGRDHLLALAGARLLVLLEDVLVARLVLLRRLLELLADLLDRGDVLGPLRPRSAARRRAALPRRAPRCSSYCRSVSTYASSASAVGVAPARQLAVARRRRSSRAPPSSSMREPRSYSERRSFSSRAASSVRAPPSSHAAAPPRSAARSVLERRALRRSTARPRPRLEERRLELLLDPAIALRDGVVVAHRRGSVRPSSPPRSGRGRARYGDSSRSFGAPR